MTTATLDTERIKNGVDLRALLGGRVELHNETTAGREQSGPCPKCGGADRLHVTAEWFFCRACHPKRGDAIEAVQWLGLAFDFRGACEYLGGPLPLPATPPKQAPAVKPSAARWQDPAWQAAARAELGHAQALLAAPAGEPGRAYLSGRGILQATWDAWGLGYTSAAWDLKLRAARPAIVIPWQRERITALKYRFLTVPTGGMRYTARAGGECLAFGLGLAGTHYATLWLCEGEVNCLAIWQALTFYGGQSRVNWDVLSFGAEGKADSGIVVDLARRYQHVIIWADNPARAAEAIAAVPGAQGLRSAEHDGVKLDAAELARLGLLGEFLTTAAERFDADPAYLARVRAAIEAEAA